MLEKLLQNLERKDKNYQPRRDVIPLRESDIAKVIELLTKARQELA